jgi:hypothetical protein
MNLSHFSFNPDSESNPISLKNPLTGTKIEYDVDACCEYLCQIQQEIGSLEQPAHDEISKIEHWWSRK